MTILTDNKYFVIIKNVTTYYQVYDIEYMAVIGNTIKVTCPFNILFGSFIIDHIDIDKDVCFGLTGFFHEHQTKDSKKLSTLQKMVDV